MEELETLSYRPETTREKKEAHTMTSTQKAETSQEFYEKYKSKRFNVHNGGYILILNYAFQSYKHRELNHNKMVKVSDELGLRGIRGEPFQPSSIASPDALYTPEKTEKVLRRVYEAGANGNVGLAVGMRELTHWLVTANDSATMAFSTAALLSNITMLNSVHSSRVKDALGNEYELVLDKKQTQDLNPIADLILHNLKYCYAYNTLIDYIIHYTAIPELDIFKVDETRNQSIEKMLEAIEADNEYYIEIPEKNLERLSDTIAQTCNGAMSWSVAFRLLLEGYWSPIAGGATVGNG